MRSTEILARRLLNLGDDLSEDLLQDFEGLAEQMLEDMTIKAGEFLHKLHINEPTEDEVKAVIEEFPSALSYEDILGYLPIYSAAGDIGSASFVPLLAEGGVKLHVGGEGTRARGGGLLVINNRRRNNHLNRNALIRLVSAYKYAANEDDTVNVAGDLSCRAALMKLRESDLLLKEDIRHYDLLCHVCELGCILRFDYLADWDPAALKECERNDDDPLLHYIVLTAEIEQFAMVLNASLRHYPEELGLLFHKDGDGDTPCEMAFNEYGKDNTWMTIENCFEQTRGNKITEKHPVTNLYPFMLAAAGETSELNTLYYLLRRAPEVLSHTTGESDEGLISSGLELV